MLSHFNFPGKDTRLVRCGSTLYKITIKSSGDPGRYAEEEVLCDGNILQVELQSAVDTAIAMTRRSKLHQFRTDHLVFMPKRRPWETSTLMKFNQHSQSLYPHPYILVITVDSCQRFLQKQNQSKPENRNQMKRQAVDKDLFVAPAPKYPKTSKRRRRRAPQSGLSTPCSIADSKCSSSNSRRGTPALDDALYHLMKDYANRLKRAETPNSFSAVKARRTISNIAEQLRPASARSRGMVTPLRSRIGDRMADSSNQYVHPNKRREPEDGIPSENGYSPSSQHTPRGQRYDLRRRPISSTPDITRVADKSPKGGRGGGSQPLKESASTRELPIPESTHERPNTRSGSETSQEKSHNNSFFSLLLTPFKRFFPK